MIVEKEKILAFCGNDATPEMVEYMAKARAAGAHVLPRNPDYFDSKYLDLTVQRVVVDAKHPLSKDITDVYKGKGIAVDALMPKGKDQKPAQTVGVSIMMEELDELSKNGQ